MSIYIADCPRCSAKSVTFDVMAQAFRARRYDWQNIYEIFSVCRACNVSTVFVVALAEYQDRELMYKPDALVGFSGALNDYFQHEGFVCIRDMGASDPPKYLPPDLENAFKEGAACQAIGCHNAASTMYRLCIDLVTRPLLPDPNSAIQPQPNARQRRDLGLRLPWLFDNGHLPEDLRDLASCIREDGNDGAHRGDLVREDAEDLQDFTVAILERLITQPKKIELASKRRAERRSS
ncbi:MAG: DUF4145 domain-containing protein [Pseudomonadota bacterium]